MSAVAALARVLPPAALAEGDGFSDESVAALNRVVGTPEAVVRPESSEEVAATMRWAAASGVGVLPIASGRRLRIGTLERPFVLLRTDRLRGVDIYEPADLTLTARAGTPMAELAERLGAHGQWLPFDPPHVESRTLGGLVAAGESGPMWMGYGELRSHVLGATVVTGDGRTLKLGGRVVKNVAGFDLLRPVVGSRGRLGVLTSVCVRAFPRPDEDCTLVLRADSARDLHAAALAIGTAPVMPASSVLLAPAAAAGAGAALVVRLHGSKATVAADHRTLERHAGVNLERVADPGDLLRATRDQATDGVVLTVRVLPSRLGAAIDAVSAALGGSDGRGAVGGVPFVADTYSAAVRVAMPAVEPAAAARLRDEVERLGGSLVVHVAADAPGAAALVAAASSPRPHEVEIAAGLERVFDPDGAFWPCRA